MLAQLISRKSIIFLLFLIISLAIHTLLFRSFVGKHTENFLIDTLFDLRGPIEAPEDVVIISMDEASYQNLNIPMNEAWPRELHSRLLQKLAFAHVKRIIFDVLFLGPGNNEKTDKQLASSFPLSPTVIGADQGERETQYGTTTEILPPYPLFASNVAEVALVGLPEELNVVRRFRLPDTSDDLANTIRPLSVAAANVSRVQLPNERDLINFYGPSGSIQSYSYYQILEEEVPFPLKKLENKTIFVGLHLRSDIGPEQKDSFLTSFPEKGRTYGVEIHATATANLLKQDWIHKLSERSELLLLSSLILLMSAICIYMQPLHAAYALIGLTTVWFLSSFLSFKYHLFVPGLTLFGVCMPLMYVSSTLTTYLITRRSQKHLERAFSYYLSPHMAKSVSKDPDALLLGGEKVYATALFSDIAGFTTVSEAMSAEDVTHMLNLYFSELVESVFESEGTLIKFIGDSVFAIWGAPVRRMDHAQAAFSTGLSMLERLKKSEKLKGYPDLPTRIGIHAGHMVVGNLGSAKRFDFTAIGDAVNIASRVEGLNKYFGTSLLITNSVVADLDDKTNLYYLGKVKVLGKTESVSLFTVFEPSKHDESYESWTAAIAVFESRSWEASIKAFHKIKTQFPYLNKAASFYIENCMDYSKKSPAESWNGDLVAKSK